jgi:hypothetical protein
LEVVSQITPPSKLRKEEVLHNSDKLEMNDASEGKELHLESSSKKVVKTEPVLIFPFYE